MRAHVTTVTAAVAVLLTSLTACGGNDTTDSKATPKKSATASRTAGTMDDSQTLKLGQSADTTGDGGTGVLQVTPDTIVFSKQATGETAANGVFAVVTMRDKATTAVAANEPAPISGGGWKWMAPDGEMVAFDTGNSSNVVIGKYNNAGPVQPGAYQWRLQAFDLTPAQAKDGTLIYVDGAEKAFRWTMPSTDAGPDAADVKTQLAE